MSERPIDEVLFDAVRLHASRTRGRAVREIAIRYEDGTATTLQLPSVFPTVASSRPTEEPPAPTWPPSDGWSFRHGEFSFNGEVHRMGGKDHALLKALATAAEPLAMTALRKIVWEGYHVEESSIRAALSRLKSRLIEMLSLPEDFQLIEAVSGAYRINPNLVTT